MEEETHGVKVEIIQGNVVHEATDAIGFLVEEDITQGGQIGAAILKAAGAQLEHEYSKLGKYSKFSKQRHGGVVRGSTHIT